MSEVRSSSGRRESKRWFAVDVKLESEAREAVEYALMEASALGTESKDEEEGLTSVRAYFDAPPERERIRAALFEAMRFYDLPSSSVRQLELSEVADRDWLGE